VQACSEVANRQLGGVRVRVRRFVHAIASLGRRATPDPGVQLGFFKLFLKKTNSKSNTVAFFYFQI
jgi:hypothetical protein